MINVIINCDEKDKVRIIYTFNILFQFLGIKFNAITHNEYNETQLTICYGKQLNINRTIFIPYYKNIENDKDKKGKNIPEISSFFTWRNKRIPFWYNYYDLKHSQKDASEEIKTEDNHKVITNKNDSIHFGFDIIMSAFHLLSCQEEYLIKKRDKHGRFLGEYSPRDNYNLLEEPLVHYYALILRECILSLSNNAYLPSSKENLRAFLTHDVDNIDKNFWLVSSKILHLLKKPSLIKLRSLLNILKTDKYHYWNFEEYIKLENKYNAKSIFYFLGGKRGRYGARYNWGRLKNIFHYIQKRGWGVGLHANYYYFDDTSNLKMNKEILELVSNSKIIGNRTHYLRFKIPETFHKLIESNIKYDTSIGYPDRVGFRAGFAFPYKPFNIERNEVINIIEIPLIIMDVVLFAQFGQDKERILRKIKELINKVEGVGGYITINWHNIYLSNEEFNGCREMYEEILNYICALGGKFITEKELLE